MLENYSRANCTDQFFYIAIFKNTFQCNMFTVVFIVKLNNFQT